MNWAHSCKRVAELLSQRLDEPLGLLDALRLRLHLSLCDNCRHVEQQLAGVEQLTADFVNGKLALEDELAIEHQTEGPRSPGKGQG